jgi:hypothetical protein
MGSGGSQSHALYATEPTVQETVVSELDSQVDQITDLLPEQAAETDDAALPEGLTEAGAEHLEKFHKLHDELKALQDGPFVHAMVDPSDEDDDLAWYAHLQHTNQLAGHHLINAVAQGLPVDQGESLNDLKGKATAQALAGLDEDQLHKIAKDQGFLYPELVGLNHPPGGNHALVHWLDPHYLPDLDSKKKIQAKAQERFTQLCAGQTVAGKTLADVGHSGYGTGGWMVTQEQYTALCATLSQQAEAFPSLPSSERAQALAQMVDAENKIFTASIDGIDTASLSGSKAEATVKVDEVLGSLPIHSPDFKMALEAAQQRGDITAEQCQVLPGMSALYMSRASVSQAEKDDIAKVADKRIAQFAEAKTWHDKLLGPGAHVAFTDDGKLVVPAAADGKAHAADVVDLAQAAQKYFAAKHDVSAWLLQASDTTKLYAQISGGAAHGDPLAPDDLAKAFKSWSVGQDKATLLQAAEALGMQDAASATKTQAKMYIAGVWGKGSGAPSVGNGAKPAPAPKKKPATATSATFSAKTAPSPAASAVAKTSFGGHHAKLLDALKHYSGAALDVPKPVDAKVVASHDFSTGTSATGLGGVHSKSLHIGPDGGHWLFKPDNTGGARAHSEAAAAKIIEAAGIPVVPVYSTKIGDQYGVVQPMVKGASPLGSDPSSWTQADVDTLVRTHVPHWVMGNHDAHHNNFLKTASGGLVPIDGGQAFKHFGRDKLSLDYHPSADAGFSMPSHQRAYQGFLNGNLAKGVKIRPEVAHPVIKSLESIPDSQWRAMLYSTAHEGAKNPHTPWVSTMRDRVSSKHKIDKSKVTTKQIAEEFLGVACERKNNLRKNFAEFFKNLALPGADALKYGG